MAKIVKQSRPTKVCDQIAMEIKAVNEFGCSCFLKDGNKKIAKKQSKKAEVVDKFANKSVCRRRRTKRTWREKREINVRLK